MYVKCKIMSEKNIIKWSFTGTMDILFANQQTLWGNESYVKCY